MKKLLLPYLFLATLSTGLKATTIPDSILNKCNTGKYIEVLSPQEKAVVLYINIAREYPKWFLETILIPYMDSAKTNKKTKYYKTLISDMNSIKPARRLAFNAKMYPLTKGHAKDMGRKGRTGHTSSNGETCHVRLYQFQAGENCSYGYDNGLDIVFQLLLDEGVPSLGHRENILNPDYHSLAVSIHKHKRYKWNCVIDFAI